MVKKAILPRLQDILDAIEGIRSTVGDMSLERYRESWQVRRATERGIEIISEASRHISDALKQEHPGVPWREIASIGNILRHQYGQIDDRIIWRVTQRYLDDLERAIQAMMAGNRRR